MEKINVFDIADFFLSKKSLTHKKVQKLVYYAYAWFIALYNQDENNIENVLFKEQPEAWIHGPVFPTLYKKYKTYSWNEIAQKKEKKFKSEDLQAFLEAIWNKFGSYSADQLECMTHQEDPWINARKNMREDNPSKEKISLKDIFVYYNSLIDEK